MSFRKGPDDWNSMVIYIYLSSLYDGIHYKNTIHTMRFNIPGYQHHHVISYYDTKYKIEHINLFHEKKYLKDLRRFIIGELTEMQSDLFIVGCRFNVVRHNVIQSSAAITRSNLSLQRALRRQQQNVIQTLTSQGKPHTSPSRASCGVSIVKFWRKLSALQRPRTAFHATMNSLNSQMLPHILQSCQQHILTH